MRRRASSAQLSQQFVSAPPHASRPSLGTVSRRLRAKAPDPSLQAVSETAFVHEASACGPVARHLETRTGRLEQPRHAFKSLPIACSGRPRGPRVTAEDARPARPLSVSPPGFQVEKDMPAVVVWRRCRRKTAVWELCSAQRVAARCSEPEPLAAVCREEAGPWKASPVSPGIDSSTKRRRTLLPTLPTREELSGGVQLLNMPSADQLEAELKEDMPKLPSTPKVRKPCATKPVINDLTPASKLVRLSIAAAELDLAAREPRLVDRATGMLHVLPRNGVVALGRCVGCEIPVHSQAADVRHCVLVCTSGTVTAENVSERGTAVNDVPLPKGDFLPQPLVLQGGDILALAPPDGPSFLFLEAACK